MIYRLLEKKNKCSTCKNKECSQAGNRFVGDFNCVSFKDDEKGMSDWQKQKEEKKKQKEYQRRNSRSGGIWDYLPEDDDDDGEEGDFDF